MNRAFRLTGLLLIPFLLTACGPSAIRQAELARAAAEEAERRAVVHAAAEDGKAADSVNQPTVENPINDLNHRLQDLGAQLDPDTGEPIKTPSVDELSIEVELLREEVARLQETVDMALSYVVGDMHEENRRLREELARVYGVTSDSASDSRQIVVADGSAAASPDSAIPENAGQDMAERVDYGEVGYKAIREWGRSAEDIKRLGINAPSLRGMIGAISPALSDAELADIGNRLREESAAFDNVAIDLFDSEDAAISFAETNTKDLDHYRLSLIKEKSSGRDDVSIWKGGVSISVPR